MARSRPLSIGAEDLLAEMHDRRGISHEMIKHNGQRNELSALVSRNFANSTNYANGTYWLTTDAGDEYYRAMSA